MRDVNKDWRLTPANAVVVVIDVQERLMAAMPKRAQTIAAIDRLVRSCRIMEMPVIVTLQYIKGLGALCGELAEPTWGSATVEKMSFSCWGSGRFASEYSVLKRQKAILCGVETHVCVQQTALDLLAAGQNVHIAADAVTSRRDQDVDLALSRLGEAGASISSVESIVFELMKEAGGAAFRQILPLFK